MEIKGLFRCFDVTASGLKAERARMNVVAQNIANAGVSRGEDGGPYRRRRVVFESVMERGPEGMSGVKVSDTIPDDSPFLEIVDPGHPHADPVTGIVLMPNVRLPFEMVDMISAARAYEANLNMMKQFREMVERALQIGR
jgi:flagellar basal-body rod protein FlgC